MYYIILLSWSINNQLKKYEKKDIKEKSHLKKKNQVSSEFVQVISQPAGSIGFCRVVAPAGLVTNPDRSSHRVDPPDQV
jgi:hypothetical protein